MRLRASMLLVALVALAFAAAASATLTPSAYRAQATAICTKRNAQLFAAGPPINRLKAGEAKMYAESYAIDERAYEELLKLDPPALLVTTHHRALQAMWRVLLQFRKIIVMPGGGAANTTAAQAAWTKYRTLFPQVSAAWKALGVEECEV